MRNEMGQCVDEPDPEVLNKRAFMYLSEPLILSDNLKCQLFIPGHSTTHTSYNSKLKIFPNPAKDYIIVSYDVDGREGKSSIVIYSIDGKPWYQRYLNGLKNQIVIPLSDFSAGIHIIQLKNKGDVLESIKFVISN